MSPNQAFEKAAQEAESRSAFGEIAAFLQEQKRIWMAPIVMALLMLGVLAFLSTTGAAPFIYTLF